MKKILLILAIITFQITVKSQHTVKDIFDADNLYFFGVDFTKAKFIGPGGFNNLEKIQNSYFYFWNQIFIDEASKYNLKKAYRVRYVNIDFQKVFKRNDSLNIYKIVSTDNSYKLNKEDVKALVNEYKNSGINGIGLIYIVEAFNHDLQEAVIWVSFFDIKTGKLLLTQRIRGGLFGVNFRNWWARGIYNVLKKSAKYYPMWKEKYCTIKI